MFPCPIPSCSMQEYVIEAVPLNAPLFHTMQFVNVGEPPWKENTPRPLAAEFPVIVQFVRIGKELRQYTPPAWLHSSFTPLPRFPVIVQFVRVGEELSQQDTPPPPPSRAEFPVIVQLVRIGEDPARQDTPPKNCPEFPEMVHPVRAGVESGSQYTPPPEFLEIVHPVRIGEALRPQTIPVLEPEIVQLRI